MEPNQGQQTGPVQASSSPETPESPVKRYLGLGIVGLVVIAIFAPPSALTQMLAWPVIGLGVVAGIKFFLDSLKSGKTMKPMVGAFMVLGGLGVGIVIFIACAIAALVIGVSKDPNPQGCG